MALSPVEIGEPPAQTLSAQIWRGNSIVNSAKIVAPKRNPGT